MSFGLRTFLEDGSVQIDTTTFSYRLLLSTVIDFSTTFSNQTRVFPLPGVTAANAYAILLPISPYEDRNQYQSEAVVGNGQVLVRNFQGTSIYTSHEVMRLIVMGFR